RPPTADSNQPLRSEKVGGGRNPPPSAPEIDQIEVRHEVASRKPVDPLTVVRPNWLRRQRQVLEYRSVAISSGRTLKFLVRPSAPRSRLRLCGDPAADLCESGLLARSSALLGVLELRHSLQGILRDTR